MNQITLVNETAAKMLSSLEVAEMVGREHKNVMRDIEKIKGDLGQLNLEHTPYFVESKYTHNQNKREYPMFLLTKKGCELYGNRMTGIEGTGFTIKYIERFNEMEQRDPITIALQAALDTRQRVDVIETDIQQLKETTRIDTYQEKQLSDLVKKKVLEAVGGKEANAYSIASRVFPEAWGALKKHFGISSYKALPKVKFHEAVELINLWQPTASLKLEINALNQQLNLEV